MDQSSVASRNIGAVATLLGAPNSLENVGTQTLDDGCFAYVQSELIHYELHKESTAPSNPPFVIVPICGVGRWVPSTGGGGTQGAQGRQGAQGAQGFQGSGAQGATGTQGFQGAQGAQGRQGFQGGGFQGAQGSSGAQGPSGGAQGAQGAAGQQGFQGSSGGAQGAQGAAGTQGSQGAQGFQGGGFQGAQGAAGSGSQGNQGAQGAQGQTGATGTGTQGAQGSTGPQGAQGGDGAGGAQGSQGRQGAAGTQGPTGAQGFQGGGFQGAQGAQGQTGPGGGAQGAQGSQGASGVQGNQGAQGFQGGGFQGAQGGTGPQGPSGGAQGAQGAQGNQGFQGFQGGGFQGAQGPTGAQGSGGGAQGAQGATGTQGAQGAQGAAGTTGAQGSQGNAGAQGNQGATGTQGNQGAQGFQGATGTQGAQGAQGAGAQGATGTQGNQGAQGSQGSGSQGAQGAQGALGVTGAQGFQGSQGFQGGGFQGAQGNQGSQGPGGGAQGAQGATGVQGFQGAQGFQGGGFQGAQGSTGAQGAGGGAQGAQGAQGSGGQLNPANIAALQAINATSLPSGTLADTGVVGDLYRLNKSPTAAETAGIDTTNVVAVTTPAGSVFERTGLVNRSFWFVNAWFIDAAGGNDANDGLSSGSALRTTEELAQRLCPGGQQLVVRQNTTVTLAAGTYGALELNLIAPVGASVSFTINGAFTSSAPITLATVVDTVALASAPVRGRITTASGTFVDKKRIRATSGPSAGAITFCTGLNSATDAWVKTWFLESTLQQVNIAPGTTVVVDTLGVTISRLLVRTGRGTVTGTGLTFVMSNVILPTGCKIDNPLNGSQIWDFSQCEIGDGVTAAKISGNIQFRNCRFIAAAAFGSGAFFAPFQPVLWGCVLEGGWSAFSAVQFFRADCFNGGQLGIGTPSTGGGVATESSQAALSDVEWVNGVAGNAIDIGSSGTLGIYGQQFGFGTPYSVGFRLESGASAFCQAASQLGILATQQLSLTGHNLNYSDVPVDTFFPRAACVFGLNPDPGATSGSQGFQGATGQQGAQGFQGSGGGAQGAQGAPGTTGPQGFQGQNGGGAQGSQGRQGATGAQGATGVQGFQGGGFQGAQGAQGQTGPGGGAQGAQGATGVQGFQGAQGFQGGGFQGAQGAQGGTGVQGSQGAQGGGFQGAQGATGTQGFQGAQGRQGNQGATGATGNQGTQGATGVQGFQGAQGFQGGGFQGAQGGTGAQGSQGAQGFQGSGFQGATGTQGFQGAQGFQGGGFQGAQGNQGAVGPGGGAQGAQGASGPSGAQGFQGFNGGGPQGSQGRQGATGAQGAIGPQGFQGSGFQGAQGRQGFQGAQGAQGRQGFQGASVIPALTQTFYVDHGNAGAADGSIARPFASPQLALAGVALNVPTTFLVAPGTYAGTINVAASADMTFVGLCGPTSQSVIFSGDLNAAFTSSVSTLTLQNLRISGSLTETSASDLGTTFALIDARVDTTLTGTGSNVGSTRLRMSSVLPYAIGSGAGMVVGTIGPFEQVVGNNASIGTFTGPTADNQQFANVFLQCTFGGANLGGPCSCVDCSFPNGVTSAAPSDTVSYLTNCAIDGDMTSSSGHSLYVNGCVIGAGAPIPTLSISWQSILNIRNTLFGPFSTGHIAITAPSTTLQLDSVSERSLFSTTGGKATLSSNSFGIHALDEGESDAVQIADSAATYPVASGRVFLPPTKLTADRTIQLDLANTAALDILPLDIYSTNGHTLTVQFASVTIKTILTTHVPARYFFQASEDNAVVVYVGAENFQ